MAKKIAVIGLGYVGLPLAIVLARAGHEVIGVDIKPDVVDAINSGDLEVAEDDIKKVFLQPEVRKNLRAKSAPCEADVFIVSVSTPLEENKNSADLSNLIRALQSIIPVLNQGNLVIIESSIPPLTCRQIVTPLLNNSGLRVNEDISLCHCPERILPGKVLKEIISNDRIIGGCDNRASELAKEIYSSFVEGDIFITDDVTAELAKLMENTYRDINIAIANEFASIAEQIGVSPMEAIALANRHPRVNILKPGIGVGGECIPVVPWFIHQVAPSNSKLIQMARSVNDEVPYKIAAKIRKAVSNIGNPHIVALGISYKPDTWDLRNSPALKIVNLLKADGYHVEAYDPYAEGYRYLPLIEAARGADCLVFLVEHQIFKTEFTTHETQIKDVMNNPLTLRFYQDGAILCMTGLRP